MRSDPGTILCRMAGSVHFLNKITGENEMMGKKFRKLNAAVSFCLVLSLLTGNICPAVYAAETGVIPEEAAGDGVYGADLIPDTDNITLRVMDENGKEISESDPGYQKALETYNEYFSQLNGKTFDASGIDMTEFIIEQMNATEEGKKVKKQEHYAAINSDPKEDEEGEEEGEVRYIFLDPGEDGKIDGESGRNSYKLTDNKVGEGKESLPEPEWDGEDEKSFTGWYDSPEGGRRYVSGSTVPETVKVLYAHYRFAPTTKDFKLGENQKMEVTLPNSNVPFLSGGLDFDMAGFSTSLAYDNVEGTYEIGIGFDILTVKENAQERGLNPRKFFGGEVSEMAGNMKKAVEAFNKARLSDLSKPMKVSGAVEPAFTIMGYLQGTYDDEGFSSPSIARVCIGFELYYNGSWQTAIVFVPVAISLKFGVEGNVTLEIEKDADSSEYSYKGRAEFVLPGIELRAGVGLAKVASIGVYGAAQSIISMELDSEKFKGDWKLTGEAGGYVTVLWWDYKKCFIQGEFPITDWEKDLNKDKSKVSTTSGVDDPVSVAGGFAEKGEYGTVRTYEDVRTIPVWVSNAKKIVIMPTTEINYRAATGSIIRSNMVETRLGTISGIAELFPRFKDDKNVLKAMYTPLPIRT